MATLNDFFNELTKVNTNLQQLDADFKASIQQLDTDVVNAVNNGFSSVNGQLNSLIQLQIFADKALFHQTQQLDTVICILEHISQNTCALHNEAHEQTALQQNMNTNIGALLRIDESVHPDAALANERADALEKQILACCPPEPEPPVCTYQPCPAPPPLRGVDDVVGPVEKNAKKG